jgi:hypothetical protein
VLRDPAGAAAPYGRQAGAADPMLICLTSGGSAGLARARAGSGYPQRCRQADWRARVPTWAGHGQPSYPWLAWSVGLSGHSSRTAQRADPGSRKGEPCERSLWQVQLQLWCSA